MGKPPLGVVGGMTLSAVSEPFMQTEVDAPLLTLHRLRKEYEDQCHHLAE